MLNSQVWEYLCSHIVEQQYGFTLSQFWYDMEGGVCSPSMGGFNLWQEPYNRSLACRADPRALWIFCRRENFTFLQSNHNLPKSSRDLYGLPFFGCQLRSWNLPGRQSESYGNVSDNDMNTVYLTENVADIVDRGTECVRSYEIVVFVFVFVCDRWYPAVWFVRDDNVGLWKTCTIIMNSKKWGLLKIFAADSQVPDVV
jgi:hypothetical protein